MEKFSLGFVVLVPGVFGLGLLVAVPLVLVVLFACFDLLIMNRGHLLGCFAHSRVIHMTLLWVFEGLISFFKEFELVCGFG